MSAVSMSSNPARHVLCDRQSDRPHRCLTCLRASCLLLLSSSYLSFHWLSSASSLSMLLLRASLSLGKTQHTVSFNTSHAALRSQWIITLWSKCPQSGMFTFLHCELLYSSQEEGKNPLSWKSLVKFQPPSTSSLYDSSALHCILFGLCW